MEFRVLGPLEVVDGLASVQLGGRKPRAVLALLVIRANHVVATDRLIEDIWDGRPPRSAMTTLQTYVSQLRRLGIVDLRTQAPGYVLEAGPESVDAERFRRAVDADEVDETPAQTVARLVGALGLWRGRPLAEFEDATWARAEREHLEALRLTAMTRVFAARLELGDHDALVPEAQTLADEHPFDERVWAQLMVALYRSHRQAEALRAYSQLRRRLGEELGIEPSPDLARLERAILLQDPQLEACTSDLPGAVTRSVRPRRSGEAPPVDAPTREQRLEAHTPGDTASVPLVGDRLTIGRSTANDLPLEGDRRVSRIHVVLERVANGWCLRDLGSRNGTFLNGARIEEPCVLRDGDELVIGGWRAHFRDDAAETGVTELG